MENLILALIPNSRYGIASRYGATLLIIGIAFLLRLSLDEQLQRYPLLLFIPAVFLTALLFDRGARFFATFVSAAVVAYAFVPPAWSFAIGWYEVLALGI